VHGTWVRPFVAVLRDISKYVETAFLLAT
jgi:hypothetical protein